MKKIIILISAFLVAAGISSAQSWQSKEAAALLREDNTRAGNNTNSYEFDKIVDTPAPKGYKPVYISHYGRHGSRSNWGGASYEYVISVMEQAKAAGILTASGDSLMNEARRVLAGYDGMDGRLSQRGVREHGLLAQRMYNRFPSVFKGARKIRSVASTSQRCIISMNAFTISLAKQNTDLFFYLDTGDKLMKYISFPKGEKYEDGSIARREHMFDGIAHDTVSVMRRLFTDPKAAYKFVHTADELMDAIGATAEIAEDFDIKENVYRYLPFDFIYKKWASGNNKLYMEHCNSVEYGKYICPPAKPLVDDIVAKADECLASGEYAADLRFGHDFPLLTFVSYLGLEGVGDKLSYDEVNDKWFGFRNICMASNFQMIFYRNKAGNVLVKFLYNEKECLLRGLAPVSGPYYDWNTVKSNLAGYLR